MDEGEVPKLVSWSASELLAQGEMDNRELAQRLRAGTAHWGRWHYVPDETAGTLQLCDDSSSYYEVDLDTVDSGAELLEWILHLEGMQEHLVSAEDLGHFVRAVARILPVHDWFTEPLRTQDPVGAVRALLARAGPEP